MGAGEYPYPGFSGRLAWIPFTSPAIVGSSPCQDAVERAGDFFDDAPDAPRVSPKPYARSRATRPPTVNRPASAIPLTETCAASATRRVARLRAASCATPASLPLRAHGTAGRGRFGGGTPPRPALRAGVAEARGRVAESFSGPTWLATRRFTSRGRCGSEGQRLRSPRRSHVGGCPKKLGASCSPRRSGGQGDCLPLPCQKIRDKGGEVGGG